ncbi:MAG TPA: twin-arginine translocase subunit TatC [Gemmatimonadaceae bacterium]|jgi:sec-independent protein translocase protein TatC
MPIPKSDAGEMPFLDHLEELRWRIIYSLGSLLVAMAIGFFVALKFDVVHILAAPILPSIPEHKLVYTHPSEGFSIIVDVATTIGLILSGPLILYQVWLFLSPALHKHEKRVAIGVLLAGALLFVAGVALAYFIVIPLAIPWLMGFAGPSLVPLITAEDYFGFAFGMMLTFGVSFELPIVVLALSALGIVTPQFLSKYRRHAIVLMVIVGAFLTPGDMVWTTVWMSVPLYGLYEMSVAAAYMMQRRKRRKRAAMEAEQAGLLT